MQTQQKKIIYKREKKKKKKKGGFCKIRKIETSASETISENIRSSLTITRGDL